MSLRHLTLLAVGCTPAAAPVSIAAEPAARARGIVGMTIVVDRPDALEVAVDTTAGRTTLHVVVRDGATEQVLGPVVLRTERDAISLGHRRIAQRAWREAWTAMPLAADEADALGRILALDITLAVQGSSIVFGDDYVACTLRCSRAEAGLADLARSADDVVLCGACLEREP